jgi:hypothetical protein
LRAAASAASSLVRAVWLNDSEPLSETGAAAELLGDAALLAALLAGGAELLLDGEEHAASASAPAVTARPAAIFLFISDLLVLLRGAVVLITIAIHWRDALAGSLGGREFVVVNRYRETYVRVVDHVKIRELDRYNCGLIAWQKGMVSPLTRQDQLSKR